MGISLLSLSENAKSGANSSILGLFLFSFWSLREQVSYSSAILSEVIPKDSEVWWTSQRFVWNWLPDCVYPFLAKRAWPNLLRSCNPDFYLANRDGMLTIDDEPSVWSLPLWLKLPWSPSKFISRLLFLRPNPPHIFCSSSSLWTSSVWIWVGIHSDYCLTVAAMLVAFSNALCPGFIYFCFYGVDCSKEIERASWERDKALGVSLTESSDKSNVICGSLRSPLEIWLNVLFWSGRRNS